MPLLGLSALCYIFLTAGPLLYCGPGIRVFFGGLLAPLFRECVLNHIVLEISPLG